MVAKKIAATEVESKGTVAKGQVHALPIDKVPGSSGERHAWLKDFWKIGGK